MLSRFPQTIAFETLDNDMFNLTTDLYLRHRMEDLITPHY